MDRRGRSVVSFACAAFLAACVGLAAESNPSPDINARRWIAADADVAAALTRAPAPCVKRPLNAKEAQRLRIGQLAFQSPALLGGQAARAGLSCETCHRNGRGNPDFHFEGISGAAGTADVSSGFFGPARDNAAFNPVSIPDLASPAGQRLVSRKDKAALETFMTGLIVEEFSGDPPPADILDGLVAYVQAIDAGECDAQADVPVTWTADWRVSMDAAKFAQDDSRPEMRAFYVATARDGLRRLHERFTVPEIARVLEDLSRDLEGALERGEFEAWSVEAAAVESQLAKRADESLYHPGQLTRALAQR